MAVCVCVCGGCCEKCTMFDAPAHQHTETGTEYNPKTNDAIAKITCNNMNGTLFDIMRGVRVYCTYVRSK